jgi:hypothetical protein
MRRAVRQQPCNPKEVFLGVGWGKGKLSVCSSASGRSASEPATGQPGLPFHAPAGCAASPPFNATDQQHLRLGAFSGFLVAVCDPAFSPSLLGKDDQAPHSGHDQAPRPRLFSSGNPGPSPSHLFSHLPRSPPPHSAHLPRSPPPHSAQRDGTAQVLFFSPHFFLQPAAGDVCSSQHLGMQIWPTALLRPSPVRCAVAFGQRDERRYGGARRGTHRKPKPRSLLFCCQSIPEYRERRD